MKFSNSKLIAVFLSFALAPLSSACLLPEEGSESPDFAVKRHVRRQSGNGLGIGTGDRFSAGTIAPRGLGTQPSGTSLGLILSVKEVSSAFQGLVKVYGLESFTTPYTTYGKASIYGAKVGGNSTTKCADSYRVFFNAAIHARERGSSDNLLYFLGDLLYANSAKVGFTYGSSTYTYVQVVKALSAGIVFLPLSNPDGVAWDQSSNSCWRKNRNPASSTGSAASIGVDLNRNFDFLWDFTKKFASSVSSSVASTSPSSETFHGTSAFSEPETKSIKWVLDTFKKVRWFLDIHSYTGDVLYNWGSDENQVTTSTMDFLNSAYDTKRGVIGDSAYKEYLSSTDLSAKQSAGTRMGSAMSKSTGRTYTVRQSAYLYPTSGASDDYSYSRSFANTTLNKVHAYTLEFGFGNSAASCPFYPTADQYRLSLLETGAGFMEFLLAAVDVGLGDPNTC